MVAGNIEADVVGVVEVCDGVLGVVVVPFDLDRDLRMRGGLAVKGVNCRWNCCPHSA